MGIETAEGKRDSSGKNPICKRKPRKCCSYFTRSILTEFSSLFSSFSFSLPIFFLFCFVCFHQSCFLTKILVRTTKLHSCHVAEETHKLSSSVAGIFPFHLMKPSLPFLLLTLSFDLSTLPFPLVMPLLKHPK